MFIFKLESITFHIYIYKFVISTFKVCITINWLRYYKFIWKMYHSQFCLFTILALHWINQVGESCKFKFALTIVVFQKLGSWCLITFHLLMESNIETS